MQRTTYILTAAFPERKPRPVELTHDHTQHCVFHAAGNIDPHITEQHLIIMRLTFKAPQSPLLPDEPDPKAMQQAQRFLITQIRNQYTATDEIKWNIKTA